MCKKLLVFSCIAARASTSWKLHNIPWCSFSLQPDDYRVLALTGKNMWAWKFFLANFSWPVPFALHKTRTYRRKYSHLHKTAVKYTYPSICKSSRLHLTKLPQLCIKLLSSRKSLKILALRLPVKYRIVVRDVSWFGHKLYAKFDCNFRNISFLLLVTISWIIFF